MSEDGAISADRRTSTFERLNREAEDSGYHLNADRDFTLGLVEGLLTNEARYGYPSCPCRLADGDRELDLDIICPCDYRDADLIDWGACYCGLYVSDEVHAAGEGPGPVPERRPPQGERPQDRAAGTPVRSAEATALPVWRCRVCGYLCARERPPGICPICKVKRDRFERFW